MSPIDSTIEGMGPGEVKLYEVHRHWFGLAIVYFQVAFGLGAGLLLVGFLAPSVFPNTDPGQRNFIFSGVLGLLAILAWLILMVYTYIYRQSKLIISDKNLTQILQHGLFHRKVSELSLTNVEDVTANSRGFFSSMFGFGELLVETAGEQNNFYFKYCPNPNLYGKIILDARQKYTDAVLANNPNP